MATRRKTTQKDIARLAGVSQATVSLVLNGGPEARARIPEETRARVQEVIRETGYVANPMARRIKSGRNRILGVFTYEPAFPSGHSDFFAPFLQGIEEEAQEQGHDLLLLTGAARGMPRRIYADGARFHIADGCVLIGRDFDRDELARLMAEDYPFVAIGRRDDIGGRAVPCIACDYPGATRALVARAQAFGHAAFAYVGDVTEAESSRDRWDGFEAALRPADRLVAQVAAPQSLAAAEILDAVLRSGATVAFFTDLVDAVRVEAEAARRGLALPGALSVVVLGSHQRPPHEPRRRFTTFDLPREEMGRRATAMLIEQIGTGAAGDQVLLQCEVVEGDTLGPVKERM